MCCVATTYQVRSLKVRYFCRIFTEKTMELLLYPWESYLERYILQILHRKTVIEINRPPIYSR